MFCTQEDVEKRLRRELTEDEETYLDGLVEEAQALVISYLGCGDMPYETVDDVPEAVRIVTSRMAARVLQQAESQDPQHFGATQVGVTAGPYSQQVSFQGDSRLGSPWLARADRETLKPYRCVGKAFSVDTAPRQRVVHTPECSANNYSNASYWYAYCTCGADIAGKPIYGGTP